MPKPDWREMFHGVYKDLTPALKYVLKHEIKRTFLKLFIILFQRANQRDGISSEILWSSLSLGQL